MKVKEVLSALLSYTNKATEQEGTEHNDNDEDDHQPKRYGACKTEKQIIIIFLPV